MTHEQKPESAEFRTRDAQKAAMRMSYGNVHDLCIGDWIARNVLEAEARGAAEQRRKDAEGAEPVGYVRPDVMEFFRQSKALFTSASIIPKRDETHTEALYTRPADVAALEARVKELEGALRSVRKAIEEADPKVLSCILWMPGQPETVVDYISAAIREGGEHG